MNLRLDFWVTISKLLFEKNREKPRVPQARSGDLSLPTGRQGRAGMVPEPKVRESEAEAPVRVHAGKPNASAGIRGGR